MRVSNTFLRCGLYTLIICMIGIMLFHHIGMILKMILLSMKIKTTINSSSSIKSNSLPHFSI